MKRLPLRVAPLLLMVAAATEAATYQVGPTRPHANLTALFNAVNLGPGDLVEVDGNVIYDVGTPGVIMPTEDGGAAGNPVTLRGIRVNNLRPHLRGGTNTIEFQLSDHVVFEGFEVSGTGNITSGTFRCIYHHAHDVVIRDAYIHDCPRHGILGADNDSGSLLVEYSEVFNAGSNRGNHAIYMATDEIAHPGSVFRLQYSYLHDSQFDAGQIGGNLIKSRAERNEIYYNWLEGAYYHELELIGPDPSGGVPENQAREDSDVVGNVIVHTGDFGSVVRFGGDATGQSYGRYRFDQQHDHSPQRQQRHADGIPPVRRHRLARAPQQRDLARRWLERDPGPRGRGRLARRQRQGHRHQQLDRQRLRAEPLEPAEHHQRHDHRFDARLRESRRLRPVAGRGQPAAQRRQPVAGVAGRLRDRDPVVPAGPASAAARIDPGRQRAAAGTERGDRHRRLRADRDRRGWRDGRTEGARRLVLRDHPESGRYLSLHHQRG